MGNMGLAGFPYNSAANVFPSKTIIPGKTVKQGALPFGVSEAEKDGMLGNNGGLLSFFEAAKTAGVDVWVWMSDTLQENYDYYLELVSMGADGIINGRPEAMERISQ